MSGHSKWSQIKRQKGVTDSRRASIFTKLSKAIAVAARNGKDPGLNVHLRLAIDKARSANMPNDNVDRAIKRGAGELEGKIIEEKTYEAYGPHGVALVIHALTDNANRTISEIRSTLNKQNGSLGQNGSVLWSFEQKGVIRFPKEDLADTNTEKLALAAIDSGAEDVQESEEGISVFTSPANLTSLQKKLKSLGWTAPSADLELIPKNTVPVDTKVRNRINALVEELEELDDVDSVYTNAQD
ncbi:MAG: YebC/PmpR family DNA-binding transcriptional regulator [bacterium]